MDKSLAEQARQQAAARRTLAQQTRRIGALDTLIQQLYPYRRLQKAIRTNNTAENLVNREFETHGPRSILLTDITYIPLNGAHCCLSAILDACTKQIPSYTLSESLEVDFVLETVAKLVKNHGISLSKKPSSTAIKAATTPA